MLVSVPLALPIVVHEGPQVAVLLTMVQFAPVAVGLALVQALVQALPPVTLDLAPTHGSRGLSCPGALAFWVPTVQERTQLYLCNSSELLVSNFLQLCNSCT